MIINDPKRLILHYNFLKNLVFISAHNMPTFTLTPMHLLKVTSTDMAL